MAMRDEGQDRHRPTATMSTPRSTARLRLLWQTSPLRREKSCVVADEIENVRAYMQEVFLDSAAQTLHGAGKKHWAPARPAFVRLGTWIGGDRDGNPFVDAGTLRYAIARDGGTAIRHYLECIHKLGARRFPFRAA